MRIDLDIQFGEYRLRIARDLGIPPEDLTPEDEQRWIALQNESEDA